MQEWPNIGKKVSPALAFMPAVSCVNLASAFRQQGQSGTAGHGLVRNCTALHTMKFNLMNRRESNQITIAYFISYIIHATAVSICHE
jgi:hypothetical protein